MALVDADYKFRWIQVSDVGSSSDGQIWNHCELRQAIEDGVIGIPDADPLPHDDVDTPFYIIADDAFAMRTWMMKPFGRRGLDHDELVFNYRLSRARRVVENAFGLLANRFRCLLSTLQVDIDTVNLIVRTCVVLHNFLRERIADAHVLDQEDANHNVVPGSWRDNANLLDLHQPQGGNRDTADASSSAYT
ncbi:putative nuclease HARBI1 [Gigantopelta aegis]|uniref:putative nuclease HARBI1 n=1 Tax=Gigantopelta aegis TaxID=1735272 RepID=UPI001B88956B|nr:putative nuclease HARBI1 [Gigantopelta aegis]